MTDQPTVEEIEIIPVELESAVPALQPMVEKPLLNPEQQEALRKGIEAEQAEQRRIMLKMQEQEKSDPAVSVFGRIMKFVENKKIAFDPVIFPQETNPEYCQFSGNVETGEGLFVRQMSFPDRVFHNELMYPNGAQTGSYYTPVCVLFMICKSVCNLKGDLVFDYEDKATLELLTQESYLTEHLHRNAMIANGNVRKAIRQVAKN